MTAWNRVAAGRFWGGRTEPRPPQRRPRVSGGFLLALGAILFPATASAADKVALVIGNANYEERSARLVNPVTDAEAVRDVLEDLGFDVTFVADADKEQMEEATDRFMKTVQPGAAALFYYAGHGVELDNRNYLAPVNASTGWTNVQTRNRSFLANEVQERMMERGAAVRILILDACRDNPFDGRSLGRGGGGAMAPRGGLVAYAAGAGQTAADDGRFAARLVEALRVPGLSVSAVLEQVAERIDRSSGGRQTPAVYSSGGVGRFVLNDVGDVGDVVELPLNHRLRAEIDAGGEEDTYRVTVTRPGKLIIRTEGDTDTVGELLDADGVLLVEDDDEGDGRNFALDWDVTPGNYYVRVRHFNEDEGTGRYDLFSNFLEGKHFCWRSMGRLEVRRGGYIIGNDLSGDCWSRKYTDRYAMLYEFMLDRAATVIIEMMSLDVDPLLVLRSGSPDAEEPNELEENDDGGDGTDARIERLLAAGTYTIEATTYGSDAGNFTLKVIRQ